MHHDDLRQPFSTAMQHCYRIAVESSEQRHQDCAFVLRIVEVAYGKRSVSVLATLSRHMFGAGIPADPPKAPPADPIDAALMMALESFVDIAQGQLCYPIDIGVIRVTQWLRNAIATPEEHGRLRMVTSALVETTAGYLDVLAAQRHNVH